MAEFMVRFDGFMTLEADEVWPDGDAPDDPTADDVKAVMEKCGHKNYVLSNWCLDQALEVYVSRTDRGGEPEVWRRG